MDANMPIIQKKAAIPNMQDYMTSCATPGPNTQLYYV